MKTGISNRSPSPLGRPSRRESEPPTGGDLRSAALASEAFSGSPSAGTFQRFANSSLSAFIWATSGLLVLFFSPFVYLVWRFERDPMHPRTSALVRLLSRLTTHVNPLIRLHLEGLEIPKGNGPFVVVANHQSLTDIPLVSHLPLPMKWVAKKSLFRVPFLGWLMQWEGDIAVDFKSPTRKIDVLDGAGEVLDEGLCIVFFPEGRRSTDGGLRRFSHGAFELAIDHGVPILPVVIDGLWDFLPAHDWRFRSGTRDIHLKVLEPIQTKRLSKEDADRLGDLVRRRMMVQLADWRNCHPWECDSSDQANLRKVSEPRADLSIS